MFLGYVYRCGVCDDKLQSTYSGEFVMCKCGESYLDQTEHYARGGGRTVYYKEDNIREKEVSKKVKKWIVVDETGIVDNITAPKKGVREYKYPNGYKCVLEDTGNGLHYEEFDTEGKSVKTLNISYSIWAILISFDKTMKDENIYAQRVFEIGDEL